MNIRRQLIGFAALALSFSTAPLADDIYKWTDAEGNVYYEDRPSGEASEVRLQFSYNRTNASAVEKRVAVQRDATAMRNEARADAAKEKLSAAESRAAAEKKQLDCQTYRAKLKTMLESRRVYREGQDGERVYLDDAQRADARGKAEELIKKTCSS